MSRWAFLLASTLILKAISCRFCSLCSWFIDSRCSRRCSICRHYCCSSSSGRGRVFLYLVVVTLLTEKVVGQGSSHLPSHQMSISGTKISLGNLYCPTKWDQLKFGPTVGTQVRHLDPFMVRPVVPPISWDQTWDHGDFFIGPTTGPTTDPTIFPYPLFPALLLSASSLSFTYSFYYNCIAIEDYKLFKNKTKHKKTKFQSYNSKENPKLSKD